MKYHKMLISRGQSPLQGRRQMEGAQVSGDACPVCQRKVALGSRGRVRLHQNSRGEECTGSGLVIAPVDHSGVGPQPIVVPPLRRVGGRPVASGAAKTVRSNKRGRLPHSSFCPECGRQTPVLGDGTFRKHRSDADAFTGAYCSGSGQVSA